MSSPLLIEMQQRLSAGLYRRTENRAYWDGRQPLAFLAPEARAALGNRFGVLSVNFARVTITALTERLRLNGFDGAPVWPQLLSLDYDQLADTLHREALLQGESFALVWSDGGGNPTVTIESGDSVAVKRDDVTRQVVAGIKQVTVNGTPATKGYTDAWLYQADAVEHWRSNAPNGGEFVLIETVPNPLGCVPIIAFTNADLLPCLWRDTPYLEYSGESEIQPLKCLIDGLAKTVADMAVAQEFTSRPRRWATGLELTETPRLDEDGNTVTDPDTGEPVMDTVNPIPEGNRAMVSEDPESRFGQLDGANLQGFKTSVDIWVQAIMTVSTLPAHMCGITTANPSTSEAMQSAEAGLTARAESKAKMFSRPHEAVARLVYAIRNGVDPRSVSTRALWGPFDVRSEAAAADAATKLYASGLLSRAATLERLGFSQEQIQSELNNVDQDASKARDITMGRYMAGMADRS